LLAVNSFLLLRLEQEEKDEEELRKRKKHFCYLSCIILCNSWGEIFFLVERESEK
jgi:hypothetical protein